MARASSNARKRPYDNRLREQQAEATRERILETMMDLLGREGMAAFSVGRVATLAGVSEPTVYRHFGSREGLLEAWGKWFEAHSGHPGFPATLEDLVTCPPAIFRYFSENAEYVRALRTAEAHEIIAPSRAKRRRKMSKLLAPLLEHLEPEDARAMQQVFALLLGSNAWRSICDEAGVAPQPAGRAIARVLRLLTEDLRREAEDEGGRG